MTGKKNRYIEVSFSEFIGLNDYLEKSNLRDVTLASVGPGEPFVVSAAESIFNQFLLRHSYQANDTSDVLTRLKGLGYPTRMIARAIAESLLNQSDTVKLARERRRIRYTTTLYLVAYSTFLSLCTLLGLIYLGRSISVSATIGLLQFEPILAFFGVLFGTIYYRCLRFLRRVL